MKHEKWLSFLMGATLAFAGSVAGVGCVITAFGIGWLMSFPVVISLLAFWSVAVAAILMLKHGGKWLALLSAALAAVLLHREDILLQVESFLNKISLVYNAAYGWGMIQWSESIQPDMPVNWALFFLGGLSATGICLTVSRRKWLAVGLVAGLLPLFLCCVVTDTVPAEGYLFLLISVLILMTLPHLAGRIRKENGIRLTAMLLIPVMLAMAVLFGQVKPENYEKQSAKLQQTVTAIMQKLPFIGSGPGVNVGISVGGISVDRVDLTGVGPQIRQNYAVMDVVAPVTRTLYLRGQALDVYDGTSWSLGPGGDQVDPFWPHRGFTHYGTVEIVTRTPLPMKYLPYYSSDPWKMQTGGIAAQQKLGILENEYSSELYLPSEGASLYSGKIFLNNQADNYLTLPEGTRLRAQALLERILTDEVTMAEKAETIRYYVENTAKYDLDTQRMPAGEEDFALWFLTESDTGYCIHFASAAAVLLRAAGIPARYVTGYTINATRGRRVTVTAEQAHAWVEYLDEDYSWKVLEATPVDPDNAQPRPTVPHITEEVTRPTEETTVPTQPSDVTQATTQPTENTTQATENTTQPTGDTTPQTTEKETDLTWLWVALKIVGWTALVVVLAVVQYVLRLRYRRKRMYTGGANRQAIYRWRYGKRLSKCLRCAMPKRLNFLADKAAYSQYRLTGSELGEFDAWLDDRHKALRNWPLLPRILVKLIFAIG